MRRLIRERTCLLVLIGLTEALVAAILGFGEGAVGVLVGLPVGLLNHWLTRLAVRRWEAGGRGAGWVAGGSMARLALGAALLWWAAGRGLEFMLGALAGLLVEAVAHVLTSPRWAGRHSTG